MTAVRASAPGKLFLLGEYAVLEGAPALLIAAGQRAVVTATSAPTWQLTAPGLGEGTIALGSDGSLPPELREDVSQRLTLVDTVRRQVDGHLGSPAGPLELIVDSTAFRHDGNKLGLGSSAAVAVALAAALIGVRGDGRGLDRDAIFRMADEAHRSAQGGFGSGGDIAASVRGGVILYRRGHVPDKVALPAGLVVFAVVTGTGSSTVDLVGQVAEYRRNRPDAYQRDLGALVRLSESAAAALGSATGVLALADEYFHALAALAQHSGAKIVSERHLELRRLAAESGAVFKPSGAGGGDVGLVFGKLEDVDALQSTFTEAGALVIPVPTDSAGVKVEPA